MAHQVTSKDIPINGEHLEKGKLATLQMICGGIGGIGLLASIIYLVNGSGEIHGSYAFSWLFAVFFVTTIVLGGCFWTFLHNLSNSGWGPIITVKTEPLWWSFSFHFFSQMFSSIFTNG